ncbi:MAG: hypothetical protein AMJ75_03815 [Phycisphaerae bacterium SM1_79]|nr:MAG: hypothetical protein AMJ75_03815 [Phycisphaerae bacterium SM1_79]
MTKFLDSRVLYMLKYVKLVYAIVRFWLFKAHKTASFTNQGGRRIAIFQAEIAVSNLRHRRTRR